MLQSLPLQVYIIWGILFVLAFIAIIWNKRQLSFIAVAWLQLSVLLHIANIHGLPRVAINRSNLEGVQREAYKHGVNMIVELFDSTSIFSYCALALTVLICLRGIRNKSD